MPVKQEDGRWVVEFQLRGIRVHRRCPKVATRAQARELETRLRREIFEARDLGRPPPVALAGAIELWLREAHVTRKGARETRLHANQLADLVADKNVADVVAVADEYRKTKGLQAATINRRLSVLKGVAKFAHRKGWLLQNLSAHIPLLPEHNARHVYLAPAEIRLLLRAIPHPESRAFVALAAYTGLRQSELAHLQRTQIKGGTIDLGVNTKTGAPRRIPIIAQARPFLRYVPFERAADTMAIDFREARKKVGLGHVRFHDLRHTTASLLIQAGADLFVVGRLLGHSAAATTARYAHLSDGTLRDAMGRLENALQARKPASRRA
jgi:integrase